MVYACTDVERLQGLLLGRLPEGQAAELEQHVLGCVVCMQRLKEVRVEDPLVEMLGRRQQPGPRPDPALVDEIIEYLRCLPQPDTVLEHSTYMPAASRSSEVDTVKVDFLGPPEAEGEIGRLGRYRVLKVLGAGGMGVVFEAEDPRLKRSVALKVMKPALAASDSARQRFLREAQAMAAVEHDHIIAIHQVDEDRCLPYLAMPLLKGETLAGQLRRQTRLPAGELLRISREVAEGLAAAHERGLIHRDIKPANIWLEGRQGRVKILDFGLVRAAAGGGAALTETGAVAGTPQYMAPEQASGKPLDPRSDLYSLGCVMYQMATGMVPFQGDDLVSVVAAVLNAPITPPRAVNPGLSQELSDLIMRLLDREPAARPASAADVIGVIAGLERGEAGRGDPAPAGARPASAPTASAGGVAAAPAAHSSFSLTNISRRRILLTTAVVLAVLGAGGLVYGTTVIDWVSNQGRIVIEADDKDIAVTINKDGERPRIEIMDRKTRRQFVLTPGPGSIEVREAPEGMHLLTREFKLTRGGKVVVSVIQGTSPPAAVAQGATVAQGDPLSPLALVASPARIAGVNSWTLETTKPRGSIEWSSPSADGRWLATVGADATVRVWDIEQGGLVRALVGHDAAPKHNYATAPLAWSPDGKHLASGDDGGTILVWVVASGAKQRRLQAPASVLHLAWSPDGKTLAAACREHDKLLLWDTDSGQPLQPLTIPKGYKFSLDWSPDKNSKAIAVKGYDGKKTWVALYDAGVGGDAVRALPTEAHAVAWLPGGKRLVTANDHDVQFWEAATGKLLYSADGLPGKERHGGLVLSADRKRMAVGDPVRGDARIWDTASGKLLPGSVKIMGGHWLEGGKTLVGTLDKVALYDSESGKLIRTLFSSYPGCRSTHHIWSPNGDKLAMSGPENGIQLWDVQSGDLLKSFRRSGSPPFQERPLAWTPGDKEILTDTAEAYEGRLYAWDVASSKLVREIPAPAVHRFHLRLLSPDGKTLAVVPQSRERTVWLGDVESIKPARTLEPHAKPITAVTWSRDGKVLVTGCDDGAVYLWDPASGDKRVFQKHDQAVAALALSADGKTIASGAGKTVLLWDAVSGADRHQLKGGDTLDGLAWPVADNTKLLTSWDGFPFWQQWDSRSGTVLRQTRAARPPGDFSPAATLTVEILNPSNQVLLRDPWSEKVKTVRTLVPLGSERGLAVSGDGHFRGSPGIVRELVYVVETDQGQETLSPEAFEKRYGWKNDPDRVQLPGK